MRMYKKLMLGLLTMGLVAQGVTLSTPFEAVAVHAENITAQGKCGDNTTYVYDADTQTLTVSGTGAMWDDYNFARNLWNTKKIVIEDGIQTIGSGSFSELQNVESLTIADSVKTIKSEAFPNVNGTVEIPRSVTKVEKNAFGNADRFIIQGDVKGYDIEALGSYLSSGEIVLHGDAPDLAKAICHYEEATIIITNDNTKCKVSNGCLISSDGKDLYYCMSNSSQIKIPDSVETIKTATFMDKYMSSIKLGENVQTIEPFAFYGSDDLNSVEMNSKLKKIGVGAFAGTDIRKVSFKSKVNIGVNAFPADTKISNSKGLKNTQTTLTYASVGKKNYYIEFAKVSGAKGYQIQVKKGKKTYKYFTTKNSYKKRAPSVFLSNKYQGIRKDYSIEAIDDFEKTISGAASVTVRPYQLNKKGKKVYGKWSTKMVLESYK